MDNREMIIGCECKCVTNEYLTFFNPSRGLFNNELYKICNDKGTRNDGRSVGEVLFKRKEKIWLTRCDEINEIEKSKGITKLDKKRKTQILSSASDEDDEEGLRHNEIENQRKNMKIINKRTKKEIIMENMVGSSLLINRPYQGFCP
ncbi:unnamed protein product [Rhizophagus irregularis]|uniref:Uncharacterized protein n=1 Tax=Rhizophagus irregularis TaxID=588596 RepID=A0A2I1G894_9GLOM|nr:hypothetical protein RhiirA4_456677 [Rhizophagus irregularis]PKY54362.1 hypothetical protein RhiirA4_473134 [Rhizophagus irregularis]CAB4404369.1 unnamed protein product [Rhizophagus irregularis]